MHLNTTNTTTLRLVLAAASLLTFGACDDSDKSEAELDAEIAQQEAKDKVSQEADHTKVDSPSLVQGFSSLDPAQSAVSDMDVRWTVNHLKASGFIAKDLEVNDEATLMKLLLNLDLGTLPKPSLTCAAGEDWLIGRVCTSTGSCATITFCCGENFCTPSKISIDGHQVYP